MADQNSTDTPQPPPPLFTLDLGANGGVFAPRSVDELFTWVSTEWQFWSWVGQVSTGNHRNAVDVMLQPLGAAATLADEARRHQTSNPDAARERVARSEQQLRQAFERGVSHSSTPLAKRVDALRKESQTAAVAYLFVMMPNQQGNRFEGHDLGSWRGFVQGLHDRFGIADAGEGQLQAQRAAFEQLESKLEKLAGDKESVYSDLESRFNALATEITTAAEKQKADFDALVSDSKQAQANTLKEHHDGMETLRATFREKMTLRASVDYWVERAKRHRERADSLLRWSFGSIVALGVVLIVGAIIAIDTTIDPRRPPEAWKLAVLGVIAVLGVWAARLVVRMFLSDRHLAVDADERVTMVQTYLALMEDKKLPSDEERKLILQPLFRPAADGIVKDEGLPHPALEWFTRSGPK